MNSEHEAFIFKLIYLCTWEAMCLKHALVTVRCTSRPVNNCRTVHTTGPFDKHPYSGAPATCSPGHSDRVPTTRGAEWYCFYTHKYLVCSSSINESWEHNKSRLGKQTNVWWFLRLSHLVTVGEKNGQVPSTCTTTPFPWHGKYACYVYYWWSRGFTKCILSWAPHLGAPRGGNKRRTGHADSKQHRQ